jgi:hypothetical protein
MNSVFSLSPTESFAKYGWAFFKPEEEQLQLAILILRHMNRQGWPQKHALANVAPAGGDVQMLEMEKMAKSDAAVSEAYEAIQPVMERVVKARLIQLLKSCSSAQDVEYAEKRYKARIIQLLFAAPGAGDQIPHQDGTDFSNFSAILYLTDTNSTAVTTLPLSSSFNVTNAEASFYDPANGVAFFPSNLASVGVAAGTLLIFRACCVHRGVKNEKLQEIRAVAFTMIGDPRNDNYNDDGQITAREWAASLKLRKEERKDNKSEPLRPEQLWNKQENAMIKLFASLQKQISYEKYCARLTSFQLSQTQSNTATAVYSSSFSYRAKRHKC